MASSRNKPPPEAFIDTLADALAGMDVCGRSVAVGLSGGVDSVALLLGMVSVQPRFGFRLEAIHVNHGLSPHADAWARHCEALCATLVVPLVTRAVSVSRDARMGPEAAARAARYEAFGALAVECVVLAHHRADQAETVLYRLLRGAGVRGCSAIAPQGEMVGAGGRRLRILRPLLTLSKATLVAYAQSRQAAWVLDESNADERYRRNFLRNQILPRIATVFPAVESVLSRSAALFAESQELLRDLAAIDLAAARKEGGLDVSVLARLGDARTRNLIRFLFDFWGVPPPSFAPLSVVMGQVFSAAPDRDPDVELAGVRVVRFDGGLYFLRGRPEVCGLEVQWRGEGRLPWGEGWVEFTPAIGHGIARDRLGEAGLRLAARRAGERMRFGCDRPRHSLKNIFQMHKVPPWERTRTPLVFSGDALVALGNLGVSAEFACPAGMPGLVVRWHAPELRMPLPSGECEG